MKRTDKIFVFLLVVTVLVVILGSFYNLFLSKKYEFIVEAACDPTTENCFYRDCSEEDACPPNGLEYFRTYNISADKFGGCSDNSCSEICMNDSSACVETICGETEEDMCSSMRAEENISE